MRLSERVGVFIFAVLLNAALLIFGVILIHQGAVHKISTGEAEIRDIVVGRATEPVSFWVSVGFDAGVGAMLLTGAIFGLWLTFRRTPSSKERDETS